MSEVQHRQSATIYQFPAGGRRADGRHRDDAKAMAAHEALQVADVVFDSGWYHQEAIQEAERAVRR